ncbi:NAD(P)-linked oxidoreductase [Ilyonectria robusta]
MGLGLVPMSGGYGAIPSDEERFKILDRAFELGITHWDSAEEPYNASQPPNYTLHHRKYLI